MQRGSEIQVWRFIDGKRGHDNQSLGLVRALADRRPVAVHDLSVATPGRYIFDWLLGRFPKGDHLPPPDLIVGAGHATHYPMLYARRRRGGKVIVLMRPSLSLRWFDLCVLPEHDQKGDRLENLLITKGVLNTISPSTRERDALGLLLIGGPSDHYQWDGDRVIADLCQVVAANPNLQWRLTTSRRTPAHFMEPLRQALPGQIELTPHQQTDPEWVARNLERCQQAWVSSDSVSMIYEALTAGCSVGLLPLEPKQRDRVVQGVERLLEEGWVGVAPAEGEATPPLHRPPVTFNEAARCAHWIEEQWLNAP